LAELAKSEEESDRKRAEFISYIKTFGGAAELDLSNCGMGSTDAKVLAELMKDNGTVSELKLVGNSLRGDGAKAISEMLKGNTSLTKVDLSDNNIGPEGATFLAEALMMNTHVRHFLCSSNSVRTAGATAFRKMLLVNKTLYHLDLSDNGIGTDQAKLCLHKVFCVVTCHDGDLDSGDFKHCVLDFPAKEHAFAEQQVYLSRVRTESALVEDAITRQELRIQDQVQAINLSHSSSADCSADWSQLQDVKQIASTIAGGFNRDCLCVSFVQPALICAKAGKIRL
jgi:hypothetical protein